MAATTIKSVVVDSGISVFYRIASPANKPTALTILLLHGFQTSSHQYRHLIPLLARHYNVVAPDLPGFGLTTVPAERKYTYAFAALSRIIGAFLDALSVESLPSTSSTMAHPFSCASHWNGPPGAQRIAPPLPPRAYPEGVSTINAPLQQVESERYARYHSTHKRNWLRLLALVLPLVALRSASVKVDPQPPSTFEEEIPEVRWKLDVRRKVNEGVGAPEPKFRRNGPQHVSDLGPLRAEDMGGLEDGGRTVEYDSDPENGKQALGIILNTSIQNLGDNGRRGGIVFWRMVNIDCMGVPADADIRDAFDSIPDDIALGISERRLGVGSVLKGIRVGADGPLTEAGWIPRGATA
ncbi:hypothetical protein DFH09DRAFT_1098071 [Mycena vulgaris]|nr:hypothetical protein DFH09DRAFT_1098071 [Mycena vulgaris]